MPDQIMEDQIVEVTVKTEDYGTLIADAIVVLQDQEDTTTPVLKQQLQQCETEIRNVIRPSARASSQKPPRSVWKIWKTSGIP